MERHGVWDEALDEYKMNAEEEGRGEHRYA